MHISASVFINDDEPACTAISRNGSSNSRRKSRTRNTGTTTRRGQRGRAPEAHHHGPRSRRRVTAGQLDFGPWEQIFYGEFDGLRRKRVLVKIIGE
jgi:hypothetical protein